MKKSIKSILLICGLVYTYNTNGYAVSPIYLSSVDGCYTWHCMEGDEWYGYQDPTSLNCANSSVVCVNIGGSSYSVSSCTSCNSGYELEKSYGYITACSEDSATDYEAPSNGRYEYTKCVKNCNSTTCASTDWTALRAGYETRIYRWCSTTGTSGTCNSRTEYRCAKNYFGSSTNGTSGCNRCWESAGAVTKAAGSTSPTDCYIPKDTAFSDTTGRGKYTADCYYKE